MVIDSTAKKKRIFPLRISAVNVTKFAGNCGVHWGEREGFRRKLWSLVKLY